MEKWMVEAKKADFNEIGRKFNISPMLARIIRNRNVIGEQEIDRYLNATIEQMHSPWLFKNMDKAVDIIKIKISQQNKIRIICDYDIDGICSGYVLLSSLEKLGAIVDVVVPHRIDDGYGLNESLIRHAYEDKIDTIITCDNGIAAYEQVEYAKSLGMTIIITDHHEVPFEKENDDIRYIVPEADAVIDHKQADCKYPFKELCGAAVAYKLIEAIYDSMGQSAKQLNHLLEYVAVATIGDVVDLQGENRIIVKHGLGLLKKSKNIGLNALINECKLKKSNIEAYHIGFVIGPCLNASGRLDTARKAIELLKTEDRNKAAELAFELKTLNDERKDMTDQAVERALRQAEEHSKDRILVIYLEDCHESIAGIIAGRIREKYNKPSFVITKSENISGNGQDSAVLCKGSGRSIEEYDMFKELSRVKELFTKFGGHQMAAGISLFETNIEKFREQINENCSLTQEDLDVKVWIDIPFPLEYVTINFIEELQLLQPYGKGNSKPVFADKNLSVKKLRIMGKTGNVLKMELENESNGSLPAIMFSRTQEFMNYITEKFGEDEVKKALRGINNSINIMITYYPNINEFNGMSEMQIIIDRFC